MYVDPDLDVFPMGSAWLPAPPPPPPPPLRVRKGPMRPAKPPKPWTYWARAAQRLTHIII